MGTPKGTLALMPLTKIDELFTFLKEAKYFRALDLHSGYYHIKLDKESIPKSTFTTVFGKIKILRLLFALSQGSDFLLHLAYFDLFRLDNASTQGQGSVYLAFLDNILIYSKTEKEHLQMLDKAFKHLLKIELSKCL